MSAPDPRCAQLSELSQVAYRLGLAFGGEAERAQELARKIEYFQLFERCFFAVRVSTALQLRLRQAAAPRRETAEGGELADPPERERRERDADCDYDRDRERDRETERASLPLLLKTLGGVAADAAKLPGPPPAALATLRELLAQVTAPTAPAVRSQRPAGALRARLTGSAAAAMATPTPPRNAPHVGLPVRRATGPPRP
jgi:hypothetical protein